MTYLSGLSGGSWPVISLATHNNPTIQDMVGYWHTNDSILSALKNTAHRATTETIFKQIVPKFEAGFNLSLLDLMGRGFGYEFVVSMLEYYLSRDQR
jgi:lysophospholipase